MEQHPVPQNISSYQFHLVGDMTLKQFLEVAGGVLIGVLFYATGLPAIIKWPLILFSAGMGAALAFVPFQERPLEKWIFAFFRSVYSPTLFHWEKKQDIKYFQDEQQSTVPVLSTKAVSNIPFLKKLEESENSYLSKISGIFAPVPQTSVVSEENKPINEVIINIPVAKNQQTVISKPIDPQAAVNASPIKIPQSTTISLGDTGPSARPQVVVQETQNTGVNLTQTNVSETLNGKTLENVQQAIFSTEAAPPMIPEVKNTVSGQVLSSDMKIIDGAILEILDANGRPVRALRTNRAGHFLIVTPLEAGKYTIVAEKDGYQFDPLSFEATGDIIQPIAIKARALA